MVTMAQRMEALRTERNLSRPALSAALGFPRTAMEKFETGRQTPTQEQQTKLADYFGVSLAYLRGEIDDPTNGLLVKRQCTRRCARSGSCVPASSKTPASGSTGGWRGIWGVAQKPVVPIAGTFGGIGGPSFARGTRAACKSDSERTEPQITKRRSYGSRLQKRKLWNFPWLPFCCSASLFFGNRLSANESGHF